MSRDQHVKRPVETGPRWLNFGSFLRAPRAEVVGPRELADAFGDNDVGVFSIPCAHPSGELCVGRAQGRSPANRRK